MHVWGFKQVQQKENIFWIQGKIQISDQTSLRICNSVQETLQDLLYIFWSYFGCRVELFWCVRQTDRHAEDPRLIHIIYNNFSANTEASQATKECKIKLNNDLV